MEVGEAGIVIAEHLYHGAVDAGAGGQGAAR